MSFTPTPINPTTDSVKPSPFITFTQRVIPATFDQSLSYQEALYAILQYLNSMSDTVNANAEITDQQTAVIEQLTDYMNHYLDNLDIQEDVNNKLDAMAEDGTLESIINQEIFGELTARELKYYDNIAELKAVDDTSLVNGDYVGTRGYSVKGDGGSAFYTITSTSMVGNDKDILALENGLFAVLKPTNSMVNVKSLGVRGDNATEEHDNIQYAINYANDNNLKCFFPSGTYLLNDSIELATSHEDPRASRCFDIEGVGDSTIFKYTGSTGDNRELFIHDYAHSFQLKNFCWEVFIWSLIPNRIYTQGQAVWSNFLNKMNANLYNVHGRGESYGEGIIARGSANTERWSNGYTQYPLYIYNNSGYNSIEIDNFGNTVDGEAANPVDNSAIGIINRVTNSAGVINIANNASAPFLRFDKSDAAVVSTRIPGMVLQCNPNGHIGIGISADFQEGSSGMALKISDTTPGISFHTDESKAQIGSIVGSVTENGKRLNMSVDGTTCDTYKSMTISNTTWAGHDQLKIYADQQTYSNGMFIQVRDPQYGTIFNIGLREADSVRGIMIKTPTQTNDEAAFLQGIHYGATGSRPASSYLRPGYQYYDTTLNKPVWWNGSAWKDATGATA